MQWAIDAVRLLPPEDSAALIGTCSLVALVSLFLWLLAVRRTRALKRRIKALEDELIDVRTAYDKEVKWRRASDRVFSQQPDSGVVKPKN
jgi:hypothetical protein